MNLNKEFRHGYDDIYYKSSEGGIYFNRVTVRLGTPSNSPIHTLFMRYVKCFDEAKYIFES